MSGLLAYQPANLRALRAALQAALHELRATGCPAPEAQAAMALVRRARHQLEAEWLPLVHGVEWCAALTGGVPRSSLGGARQAIAAAYSAVGWTLVPDPAVGVASGPTAATAAALGERLNDVDVAALLSDTAALAELAAELEGVARDPVLARAFLDRFQGWTHLCDRFGYRRIDLVASGNDEQVAAIDRVFHAFAAMVGHDAGTPAGELPPQLDGMAPYAAALLVQHLALEGEALAAACLALLERWLATSTAHDHRYDDTAPGANTADLLFALLLRDPEAAARFVHDATYTDLGVLFESAEDPALAFAVALAGTDPEVVDAAVAGDTIVPILEWFRLGERGGYLAPTGPTHPIGWELFLVDLVTPWLFHFSPAATEWPSTAQHRADLLAFVIADGAALERLFAEAQRAAGGLGATLTADGTIGVIELAGFLSLLDSLIAAQRVRDAELAQAEWDFWLGLTGTAVSAVAGLTSGPLGSAAGGAAVDAGAAGLTTLLGQWAPDPGDVAAREQHAHDYRFAVLGAAAAAALHARWLDDDRVGPGTPPPPEPDPASPDPLADFHRDFVAWLHTLPGGAGGALAIEALAVVSQFVNAEAAARDLAD